MTQISVTRPNSAIATPSTYRVIRDEEQFEIIVDEELSDRDKEALRFQFVLQQWELLDELLGSNLENNNNSSPPEIIKVLSSDSYNLPIPEPITDKTLFLRDEIVRLQRCSAIQSLIDDERRERIESLRARQMEIGIWLYRLPTGWIDLMLN